MAPTKEEAQKAVKDEEDKLQTLHEEMDELASDDEDGIAAHKKKMNEQIKKIRTERANARDRFTALALELPWNKDPSFV